MFEQVVVFEEVVVVVVEVVAMLVVGVVVVVVMLVTVLVSVLVLLLGVAEVSYTIHYSFFKFKASLPLLAKNPFKQRGTCRSCRNGFGKACLRNTLRVPVLLLVLGSINLVCRTLSVAQVCIHAQTMLPAHPLASAFTLKPWQRPCYQPIPGPMHPYPNRANVHATSQSIDQCIHAQTSEPIHWPVHPCPNHDDVHATSPSMIMSMLPAHPLASASTPKPH